MDRLLGGAASEFYDNLSDAQTPRRTIRGITATVEEIGAAVIFDWYQLELVPAVESTLIAIELPNNEIAEGE